MDANERGRFEAWYPTIQVNFTTGDLDRNEDGYASVFTHVAWLAWQAALASAPRAAEAVAVVRGDKVNTVPASVAEPKDAVRIFMVYAVVEYEGSWPVLGFERREDADAFRALCEAHETKRPKCPDLDNHTDEEWTAWDAADEAWKAAHPGGDTAWCCHLFDVGELECLPAQEFARRFGGAQRREPAPQLDDTKD